MSQIENDMIDERTWPKPRQMLVLEPESAPTIDADSPLSNLDFVAHRLSHFSAYYKARRCDLCESNIGDEDFARDHAEGCPVAIIWMALRTAATRPAAGGEVGR